MDHLEKLTDMEVITFFKEHIENPCEVEVGSVAYNIRKFYLRRAKENLPKLTNPFAINYLNSLIKRYS